MADLYEWYLRLQKIMKEEHQRANAPDSHGGRISTHAKECTSV